MNETSDITPDKTAAADTEANDATEQSPHEKLKVDELKQEIADRNEGRDEKDRISDAGTKAELVAALDADDASPTPKPVKIQLRNNEPIEVLKPSAEYTQFVFGYGYKEV